MDSRKREDSDKTRGGQQSSEAGKMTSASFAAWGHTHTKTNTHLHFTISPTISHRGDWMRTVCGYGLVFVSVIYVLCVLYVTAWFMALHGDVDESWTTLLNLEF